jgi:hypothetical protein
MPMLHDPTTRASIEARLNSLQPDADRQWGSMTAAQMLWHLNGAPTHPQARAEKECDFSAERERCLALIDKFVSRPLDGPSPADPAFGKVTGKFASKLQAKHFDHHLRQFSA